MMLRRLILIFVPALFLMLAALPFLIAQTNAPDSGLRFKVLPSSVKPAAIALGDRVRGIGKERTTLTGEYADDAGHRSPAQVIHQLPGLVEIRGFVSGNRVLKFDGDVPAMRHAPDEEAWLETFVADSPEGMLSAIEKGAAVRVLGRFFKPAANTSSNDNGPGFDIYEVTAPALGGADTTMTKLYYFDSNSHLLMTTRHTGTSRSPSTKVETKFLQWRQSEGSVYPGRIERYEDDRLVFSFTVNGATSGPGIDPANFR